VKNFSNTIASFNRCLTLSYSRFVASAINPNSGVRCRVGSRTGGDDGHNGGGMGGEDGGGRR
jgi:uncharacterized membrane protein